MPSFADSFWTADYASGIDILFSKLYQGCVENDEFIALFTRRMEIESAYGKKLSSIPSQHDPNTLGFARDEGASLKSSFVGLSSQLGEEGQYHYSIAENIRVMVLEPFGKWSLEHKQRVQYSEKILKGKLKDYTRLKQNSEKSQKKYFNKCRILEEVRSNFANEKDFLQYLNEEDSSSNGASSDKDSSQEVKKNKLGAFEYDQDHIKEIIKQMLSEIPRQSYKVTLLGTYMNCSTGSSIVQWMNKKLGITDVSALELMGQDLIENGFLRLVGSVGKSFVNSSQLYYQWKPYSFEFAQVSDGGEKKANLTTYFDDIMSNVTKVDINDKTTVRKLYKEVEELDREFLKDVLLLDEFRCSFEEAIIDHYSFLEKCELDRLKLLKKVTLDFTTTISNTVASLKLTMDQFMVFEESIQPVKDLNFLMENYRTGYYQPKVPLYDNFYQSTLKQIFGVDLTIRCRFDKKLVPLIVSSILVFMDSVYPVLEDDETRLNCWILPVKLQITHEVRSRLNELAANDSNYSIKTMHKIFNDYQSPSVVASVLKLYLLELPDSLIPLEYYDMIKLLYTQYPGNVADDGDEQKRVTGLTKFLSNLPTLNVATLDSVLTHFTRMINAVVADGSKTEKKELVNNFVHNLANEFSTIILRSAHSNTKNLFATKLFKDLLEHKNEIFDELKAKQRSVSQKRSLSGSKSKSLPKVPREVSRKPSGESSESVSTVTESKNTTPVELTKSNTVLSDDSNKINSES